MTDKKEINNKVLTRRSVYNDEDSGLVFLFLLLTPLVLSIIVSFVVSSIAQGQGIKTEVITSSKGYVIATSLLSLIIYFGIYFFYTNWKYIDYKAINLKFKMTFETYLLLLGIGVLSILGIQYFIGAFDNFLTLIKYPLQNGVSQLDPTNWGNYILSIIFLAVLPAIYEELMFRGVILNGLRSRFGDYSSVLLSALMFALMHQNLQQLLYPFILGCVMGWIVLRTGSLVSSMIVHMVNNFLVVTFAFVQYQTGFSLALPNAWWFYLVAIALFALTIGIYFLIDKYLFKHKSNQERERSSQKTSKFIYISLAIACVLFVISTVLQWTT